MIAKVSLLVLLGSALVLASPVQENSRDVQVIAKRANFDVDLDKIFANTVELDLFDESFDLAISQRSALSDKWEQVKQKWENWLDKGREKWEDLKEVAKEKYEIIKAKWNNIREKGLALIEQAKQTFVEIKAEGMEAYEEIKDAYEILKGTWHEVKDAGTEAYQDIKELLVEVEKALKELKTKVSQKLG